MPASTQAALDYLGRRLDELADAFPTTPAAVDVVTLTDDIALERPPGGPARDARLAAGRDVRGCEGRA
ncbi:hypothetical protein [Streptomyces sp. NBC_00582]|uniref:hypothetical protein n=1 Tax=Streptomyces sp. NBC_00582 TaxID=2975783 RepID=UPI002E808834|nr:hypothetical protein [Streptomyces sp. NBC_00582]WUB60881.1 hypothetical protein OG852_11025 [Streptomyces sp. NBC_00582]